MPCLWGPERAGPSSRRMAVEMATHKSGANLHPWRIPLAVATLVSLKASWMWYAEVSCSAITAAISSSGAFSAWRLTLSNACLRSRLRIAPPTQRSCWVPASTRARSANLARAALPIVRSYLRIQEWTRAIKCISDIALRKVGKLRHPSQLGPNMLKEPISDNSRQGFRFWAHQSDGSESSRIGRRLPWLGEPHYPRISPFLREDGVGNSVLFKGFLKKGRH